MPASRCLLPAILSLLVAACATEDSGSSSAGFSTCFAKEVADQLGYCLASEGVEDDFYRVRGRHQIIYGSFNEVPSMTKEGVSQCLTGRDGQSLVNACTPEEVMTLAKEQLDPADASMCEALLDPRKSLASC